MVIIQKKCSALSPGKKNILFGGSFSGEQEPTKDMMKFKALI
jgi:hypothetical protein